VGGFELAGKVNIPLAEPLPLFVSTYEEVPLIDHLQQQQAQYYIQLPIARRVGMALVCKHWCSLILDFHPPASEARHPPPLPVGQLPALPAQHRKAGHRVEAVEFDVQDSDKERTLVSHLQAMLAFSIPNLRRLSI